MEKEYIAKMFAEYHELCELSNGKVITLEAKDYGRLKSTLDVLELGGYIRDLNIDGGHIYAVDESFEYYDLFTSYEEVIKERNLSKVINDIKRKYGKNSILKGISLSCAATARERNRQIGGHKSGEN